jgi:hypothetical protein
VGCRLYIYIYIYTSVYTICEMKGNAPKIVVAEPLDKKLLEM